jgi:hypothetical protein
MHIRLAALVVAVVVTHAAAQVSDVRVMSSGATAPACLQLVAPFESATKLKALTLALSNGVGAANIATRVRGGEAVDVLFLSDGVMDDMIRDLAGRRGESGWLEPLRVLGCAVGRGRLTVPGNPRGDPRIGGAGLIVGTPLADIGVSQRMIEPWSMP